MHVYCPKMAENQNIYTIHTNIKNQNSKSVRNICIALAKLQIKWPRFNFHLSRWPEILTTDNKKAVPNCWGKLTEFLPPPIEKFAPVKSTATFFSIFLLLRAERCLTMIMKKNNMPIPRFDKGISVFARKSLTLAHNKRQRVWLSCKQNMAAILKHRFPLI